MNISKEQIDEINVVVSVEISKDDYDPKVREVLRDYRRRANMPGFRPGKVPEGLIRKMYGKAVLIDELNKLVSESLQNYITEQELHLLGDPMPKLGDDEMDWEIGNDFTFDFEMGLAPIIDVQLSEEDHLTKYQITVEQDMIDKEIERYAVRYGQFVDTDAVVDFKEQLAGDVVHLDNDGQPLQDGLSAEDTTLNIALIRNEECKTPFENAKAGDEIVFNLSETFPNDWEIVSILKKKEKEEVGDVSGSLFRFAVKAVRKFANAELNQELFDKVFSAGAVSGVDEYKSRIEKDIATNFEERSLAKFTNDAREYLIEKFNPPLPEEHLRKWMLSANNKEVSEDIFEKEFPVFLKSMKWDLIVKAISKKHEITVTEQEIIAFAKTAVRQQFAMYYGVDTLPDETLTKYAMNSLKDEKQISEIAAQVLEKKVAHVVSEIVAPTIQEISLDEFNKILYAPNDESDEEISNDEEAVQVEEVGQEIAEEAGETEQPEESAETGNNGEVEEKE